jgi:hypothetical protein
VEGSCEHGKEPSGSIKRWEILESERLAASQDRLSSMELISSLFEKNQVRFLAWRPSVLTGVFRDFCHPL